MGWLALDQVSSPDPISLGWERRGGGTDSDRQLIQSKGSGAPLLLFLL